GRPAASAGDGARAREALAAARPERGVSLYLAQLELEAGAADRAAARSLELVRQDPHDAAARALYLRAALPDEPPAGDMYALATRAHSLMLARLPALAPDAARMVESYDRPLLVTVMGEFSSGKSTFVNAFLGADVAPVGITPTTATINILKYGREQGARVVYRDDRVRDLPWDEAAEALRAVDGDE